MLCKLKNKPISINQSTNNQESDVLKAFDLYEREWLSRRTKCFLRNKKEDEVDNK